MAKARENETRNINSQFHTRFQVDSWALRYRFWNCGEEEDEIDGSRKTAEKYAGEERRGLYVADVRTKAGAMMEEGYGVEQQGATTAMRAPN